MFTMRTHGIWLSGIMGIRKMGTGADRGRGSLFCQTIIVNTVIKIMVCSSPLSKWLDLPLECLFHSKIINMNYFNVSHKKTHNIRNNIIIAEKQNSLTVV